jgi:hypothetical protein
MPSSPADTLTPSPLSKSTRDPLSASDGGEVSNHFTLSVGTESGSEALQNFPAPANTNDTTTCRHPLDIASTN